MVYGFFYNICYLNIRILSSIIQVILKVCCYCACKIYRSFRVLLMQGYQVSINQFAKAGSDNVSEVSVLFILQEKIAEGAEEQCGLLLPIYFFQQSFTVGIIPLYKFFADTCRQCFVHKTFYKLPAQPVARSFVC
jgi:hypothetical protein